MTTLQDFYKSSGMLTEAALVQKLRAPVELPATPSTWDASYTGVMDPTDPASGILAVLQKVMADFAEMESNTRAQEATDQHTYEQNIKASEIQKAEHLKAIEVKGAEQKRLEGKISMKQSSHKLLSGEHESVVQYISDLQKACVDGDSTYEERKASRAMEVQALQ